MVKMFLRYILIICLLFFGVITNKFAFSAAAASGISEDSSLEKDGVLRLIPENFPVK